MFCSRELREQSEGLAGKKNLPGTHERPHGIFVTTTKLFAVVLLWTLFSWAVIALERLLNG